MSPPPPPLVPLSRRVQHWYTGIDKLGLTEGQKAQLQATVKERFEVCCMSFFLNLSVSHCEGIVLVTSMLLHNIQVVPETCNFLQLK